MRALLDVNVLIALHDREHVHHAQAAAWFAAHAEHGWASCTLTQNGCLRIMSLPAYGRPRPLSALVAMLQGSTATPYHRFWSDDASLLDASVFRHDRIHSASQITDLYLLALAVKNGGRLVSFDRRVPLAAVHGAEERHRVCL